MYDASATHRVSGVRPMRTLLSARRSHSSRTCVVLGLQVQLVQLMDVTDVHLLLVELRLIEVLRKNTRKRLKRSMSVSGEILTFQHAN